MFCNSLRDPVCIYTIAMMEDEWIIIKNISGMTLKRKKYKACRETPFPGSLHLPQIHHGSINRTQRQ